MTEVRTEGWLRPVVQTLVGVGGTAGMVALAVWMLLRRIMAQMDEDARASFVLMLIVAMLAGALLFAVAAVLASFAFGRPRATSTPAAVIDADYRPLPPQGMSTFVAAGPRSYVAQDTAERDAVQMLTLRPFGISPTEAACAKHLNLTSSRRVQAAWGVLERYALLTRPGQGSAVMWVTSPGEEEE